ncbi:hypothetical protein NL676_039586 [Syzygium grande]|nr:hypothetical protein NL676_039586 [Syzygium grande]
MESCGYIRHNPEEVPLASFQRAIIFIRCCSPPHSAARHHQSLSQDKPPPYPPLDPRRCPDAVVHLIHRESSTDCRTGGLINQASLLGGPPLEVRLSSDAIIFRCSHPAISLQQHTSSFARKRNASYSIEQKVDVPCSTPSSNSNSSRLLTTAPSNANASSVVALPCSAATSRRSDQHAVSLLTSLTIKHSSSAKKSSESSRGQ